jgi:LEA14-like dessication related protein
MKNSWIYIVIGIVVLSVVGLVIKAKSWKDNFKYGLANGIKLLGLNGKNISVLIPIYIYNPTPFKMVVSDLNLDVYFNGFKVSTIQSRSNYALTSQEYSTYPITVLIKPMDVINLLADQGAIIDQPDWLKKVNVRILGSVTMYAGVFTIKDYEIDITDSLKSYLV